MARVDLVGIRHGYDLPGGGRREVLRDLGLSFRPGGFHVILGRSGCGKSTLLRLIAGLERPDAGEITTGGARIGIVFQEPRLMPWLTVAGNAGFLVKGRGDAGETADRVARALATVGLTEAARQWPGQLSGGMAQRVAIARALVTEPEVLLMDEPFGALDAFTRKQMQDELVEIWARLGQTVVFITHDIDEALRLGQFIFVIEAGRVALDLALDASLPRGGAEPAVNAARQRLLDQLFARAAPPGWADQPKEHP
ncbi:MAG: hypothetical protein DI556_14945 [Rhodovulum sulfidophilum]|uniref:ABC transporter domain-containing protein n=1 Tax=Rhodovulum sulfidophilum TaxID=35806 RepID=A0A2W5N703_RHOSU|nr:MAG: hypothetical protein DI556_14945 [Rhodovulum sulfidophilum]